MADQEPDPKETAQMIDRLVKTGRLSEAQFQQMHHLGRSISSFRKYCHSVQSFQINGNNRILHEKLVRLESGRE